ncbi:MAG: MBL fold metallo-hydrolase [Chloroflexi bacterium]|nr:MBL fold metallo-hydrolase [Chloroflexota bacterium]
MNLLARGVTAVILGIMQDGGLPHVGCRCPRCSAAYADPRRAEHAACLGLVDHRGERPKVWLIDATPDIKYQLDLLAGALGAHPTRSGRLRQPDGVFFTHAHMGHIGGLPHLGPEAMAAVDLPVYAAPGLLALLRENRLWRPMVEGLDLRPLTAHKSITLATDLAITPIPVPHRDEWSVGTFAFHIRGPNRAALYLPDIDAWEQWPSARETLAAVDYALVDASFYSVDELGGNSSSRNSSAGRPPVAHPLVPDTLERFADLPGQLILTHLNHTNPILDPHSDALKTVLAAGVWVAYTGQTFVL